MDVLMTPINEHEQGVINPPMRRKRDSNRLLRSMSDGEINTRSSIAKVMNQSMTHLDPTEESLKRDSFAIVSKLVTWCTTVENEEILSSSSSVLLSSNTTDLTTIEEENNIYCCHGHLTRSRSDGSGSMKNIHDIHVEQLSLDLDDIYHRLWRDFSLQIKEHAPSFALYTPNVSHGNIFPSSSSSHDCPEKVEDKSFNQEKLNMIIQAIRISFTNIRNEIKRSNKFLDTHLKVNEILCCILLTVVHNSLENVASFFLGLSEEKIHGVVKEYVQG